MLSGHQSDIQGRTAGGSDVDLNLGVNRNGPDLQDRFEFITCPLRRWGCIKACQVQAEVSVDEGRDLCSTGKGCVCALGERGQCGPHEPKFRRHIVHLSAAVFSTLPVQCSHWNLASVEEPDVVDGEAQLTGAA